MHIKIMPMLLFLLGIHMQSMCLTNIELDKAAQEWEKLEQSYSDLDKKVQKALKANASKTELKKLQNDLSVIKNSVDGFIHYRLSALKSSVELDDDAPIYQKAKVEVIVLQTSKLKKNMEEQINNLASKV